MTVTPYGRQILEIAPDADPRHVEAFMRVGHPTLDHLTRRQFAAEVRVALEAIDQCEPGEAEAIAQTLGF